VQKCTRTYGGSFVHEYSALLHLPFYHLPYSIFFILIFTGMKGIKGIELNPFQHGKSYFTAGYAARPTEGRIAG
jgi:hypothetical protein